MAAKKSKTRTARNVLDIPNELGSRDEMNVPHGVLTAIMASLVVFQLCCIAYFRGLTHKAGSDTSGLEVVGAFVIFPILAISSLLLCICLLTIAPWRKGIPQKVRLVRLLLVVTGVAIAAYAA